MEGERQSFAVTLLTFVLLSLVSSGFSESYRDKKVREMTRDLQRSRESLHQAHEELGRKADRIAKLEALLKENGIEIPPVETLSPGTAMKEADGEEELSSAISRIRDLEKRLQSERGESKSQERVVKKVSPDKANASKVERMDRSRDGAEESYPEIAEGKGADSIPSGAMIVIHYEENSAVNLEGRDRILEFVKGVLKRSPEAVFLVEGAADDSEYETSDSVIAENRAKFVVEYLKYKEIPEEVFREIRAFSSKGKDGPRKFVRISVISG